MNKTWKWILGFGALALVAFFVAVPIFGSVVFGGRGGFGFLHGGLPMMGGRGGFGMFPGFGLGMFLVPLLLIALLVFAGVKLFGNRQPNNQPQVPAARPCQQCGQPVQTGWVACPHCGEKLS